MESGLKYVTGTIKSGTIECGFEPKIVTCETSVFIDEYNRRGAAKVTKAYNLPVFFHDFASYNGVLAGGTGEATLNADNYITVSDTTVSFKTWLNQTWTYTIIG